MLGELGGCVMDVCRETIMSEEYGDFIVNFVGDERAALEKFKVPCFQRISSYYGSVYSPLNELNELSLRNYSFASIPALYGLMERDLSVRSRDLQQALEKSGILRLQKQPILSLKGQGCIMAFIDTGIDIFDRQFRYSNGDTRIIRIWDMTDDSGTPPEGILYGSEYTEEDINKVLRGGGPDESETNEDVGDNVKVVEEGEDTGDDVGRNALGGNTRIGIGQDERRHGNILAKIAAGNDGAVPEAYIVVVKLKPAKRYLRDYYFVKEDAVAFQENDIMLAVNYVRSVSIKLNMPISLCMTLGTNGRGHDGSSALSYIIDRFVSGVGAVISMSVGDEGNKQLHASGQVVSEMASPSAGSIENVVADGSDIYNTIEVRVDERQQGLVINIWGGKPGLISVGVVSPTGEVIERVEPRIGKSEIYDLIFDGTTVTIEYDLVEGDTGDELIIIRLETPTAGIWSIRVYGDNQSYNVYLPISQFIYENTYILEPDSNITIVDPALANGALTTSLYNPVNGALYINNGRGFARNGAIKPNIATALSSGITAGAACQFLNWGIVEGKDAELRATDIKSYLIRGAIRDNAIPYPDRQWGYGKMDVYNSFEVIRG